MLYNEPLFQVQEKEILDDRSVLVVKMFPTKIFQFTFCRVVMEDSARWQFAFSTKSTKIYIFSSQKSVVRDNVVWSGADEEIFQLAH